MELLLGIAIGICVGVFVPSVGTWIKAKFSKDVEPKL